MVNTGLCNLEILDENVMTSWSRYKLICFEHFELSVIFLSSLYAEILNVIVIFLFRRIYMTFAVFSNRLRFKIVSKRFWG